MGAEPAKPATPSEGGRPATAEEMAAAAALKAENERLRAELENERLRASLEKEKLRASLAAELSPLLSAPAALAWSPKPSYGRAVWEVRYDVGTPSSPR